MENSEVENLMGLKKFVNIWRPHNGLEFKSHHV
jgi:hypothetical protein